MERNLIDEENEKCFDSATSKVVKNIQEEKSLRNC